MSTIALPDWMTALQQPLPGETAGMHLARAIRAFVGVSLTQHVDKLDALFLANEQSAAVAAQVAGIQTNCGTFMRCIYALCGCPDLFVLKPYQSGMAVSWDLQAAQDMGCLIDCRANPDAWKLLDAGWGIHYDYPGTNEDHMEFCLTKPDLITGVADHAGGGRANNSITLGTGDIRYSLGRPILHIIRPDKMATAGAPLPDPTPQPVDVSASANEGTEAEGTANVGS